MFTPAYDWLFKTGLPSEFYSRDYVHSCELGKQIIGRIALGYFAAANKNDDMTAAAAAALCCAGCIALPDRTAALREAAALELERLGRRYDAKSALKKNDGDFRELIADTLKVLNGPL